MLQINASIAMHQDKTWCVYQTKHLRHYNAEYFLVELDSALEPVSDKLLLAGNGNTAFDGIKLFSFKDKLLAFYNYFPFQENKGWTKKYEVGCGEIDTQTGIIKNQISLGSLSKKADEKNWSPYEFNGEVFMVTDFDPFLRIVKIGLPAEPNGFEEIFISAEETKGWAFGALRGGTPLISKPKADDGWLYGFAHSYRTNEKGFKRYYYYTAVRLNHQNKVFEYHPLPLPYAEEQPDEAYNLLWKRSNGMHHKVILPNGIMHHDNGVVVCFGKDDVSSYTEYFSWERINAYFN